MVTQEQANQIAGRLYDMDAAIIRKATSSSFDTYRVICVSDRAAHAIAEIVDNDISHSELFDIAKNSDYFIDFEDGDFAID